MDDKIKKLADDMLETMRVANGVGLAAQQVGVPIQLTVIDVAGVEDRPAQCGSGKRRCPSRSVCRWSLLNPVLKLSEEKEIGNEGCLSFPDITAEITRSSGVRCTAQLLDGTTIEFEAAGLLARALQHETDHLQRGTLH